MFLDIVFPNICMSCGNKMDKDDRYICKNCKSHLIFLDTNICPVCGSKLLSDKCDVCAKSSFLFDKARSVYPMSDEIRNMIHNFKYKDLPKVGLFFVEMAGVYLKKNQEFMDTDFVVPVPLHKVKNRIRGFNQAEIIAKGIAKLMNVTFSKNIVLRKKFTETQTKLSRKERAKNVSNAFNIKNKEKLQNKNFIIIDDVFTTGSTVNAITQSLKDNGASKVYILTAARAQK